jgi:hypothetical protein
VRHLQWKVRERAGRAKLFGGLRSEHGAQRGPAAPVAGCGRENIARNGCRCLGLLLRGDARLTMEPGSLNKTSCLGRVIGRTITIAVVGRIARLPLVDPGSHGPGEGKIGMSQHRLIAY